MYSELFTTTANKDFRGQIKQILPTFVRQQSIVQEFGGGSKVHRDVSIREVVYFNAHILNVHAGVKRLVGVDSCTVSCVQDVCDAHSLQTGLIHCNRPEGGEICLTVRKMTHPNFQANSFTKKPLQKMTPEEHHALEKTREINFGISHLSPSSGTFNHITQYLSATRVVSVNMELFSDHFLDF